MAVEINYVAVVAAAVVSMILGFLWYGPLFGKTWMALMKIKPKDIQAAKKKGMEKTMALGFLTMLIMAYVLAHFVDYAAATTAAAGATVGALAWLGFVATVTAGSVLWEGKPTKLYALNNAYQLVSLAAMGAILAVWV